MADPGWVSCGTCDCVDGEAPIDRWEIEGVLKTRTCPRLLIDVECDEWLSLFAHYRAGHLLVAGGIGDQPAAYFAAMNFIANWVAKERDNTAGKI